MAKNKVEAEDASDSREREIKTAPELTEEQTSVEQNVDPAVTNEDTGVDAPDTALGEPAQKTPRPAVLPPETPKRPFPKRVASWLGSHKKVSIPLAVLALLGVLAAIPATRFAIAGTVLKQQFSVTVVDAETKQPVTSAKIRIDGVETTTDNKGKATAKVAVGPAKVEVSKKYFKSASQDVTVPILKQKDVPQLRLQATGRQVNVKVVNKLSKKPLANVTIVAADTEAKTDNEGKAALVVPAGDNDIEATLKVAGFNESKVTVQVMKGEAENSFALTPSGKVYFLSNQTGKLDVVKTNLDGTDRQTVLAGTGKEEKSGTSLLASRDWRYLALLSRRDSEKSKLYLIDTQTDKLTVMDEGDASFTLIGWEGHSFIYRVDRTAMQWYEAKRTALKSYNAESGKLATLDQNASIDNNTYEIIRAVYIIENKVVYAKQWYSWKTVQKSSINSISSSGKDKKVLKEFDSWRDNSPVDIEMRPSGAQSVYIMSSWWGNNAQQRTFDEYSQGQVKTADINDSQFNSPVITYLVSPSGERTFWSEERDGLQAFFVGNTQGHDEERIATLAKYNAYGWYGDDYVLIAKEGSQLYIAPRDKINSEADLSKITDYYRPGYSYNGYGYGYGGL